MSNFRPPTEREQQLKKRVAEMMIHDRSRLLQQQPFIGNLAMHLNLVPVIDARMTTACTDGTRLFMDAEFYCSMTPAERIFVLAHEVWHCALRHFQRKGNRDRFLFNYASDVEVDILLEKAGFRKLSFSRWIWDGRSAEQIYDTLLDRNDVNFQEKDKHIYPEDFQKGNNSDSSHSEERECENGQAGIPKHEQNEQPHFFPVPKSKNADGIHKSKQTGNAKQRRMFGQKTGEQNNTGSENQESFPKVSHNGVVDPDYQPRFEEGVEDDWKNNLKSADDREKKRTGKRAGILPRNVEKLIDADNQKATVDWKRVLLDYVTQIFGGDRQWLPPARRYVWKKLYLPSRARKKTLEIVLAIDTSGSMTHDLPDFLTELRGMVNAFGEYKLTIIQCDTKIHSVKEYSNDDPLPVDGLRFHGFGGTSFLEPFRYVEEKMEQPAVFIYLTDGFGNAPAKAPGYPVIWGLTKDGKKPAKWGLEVKITQRQNS